MKTFFKWVGYFFLGVVGVLLYAAFEQVRTGVHAGAVILFVGWVARDLIQQWVREVVRSELDSYANRTKGDSERLARIDAIISRLSR